METQNNNNDHKTVKSEIALFLEQWDKEVEATQLALRGYALTARHAFITKRMQAFGDDKMVELMTLEAKKMNEDNKAQNNMPCDGAIGRGDSK